MLDDNLYTCRVEFPAFSGFCIGLQERFVCDSWAIWERYLSSI